METALSIALGIALSAAAGFRVFVPLLALSIAGYTDVIHLTPGFAWIGTIPSMIAFGTATVAEVAAYYVPWVDNALDTIAAPAAVIAGTVISASVITSSACIRSGVTPISTIRGPTRTRHTDCF